MSPNLTADFAAIACAALPRDLSPAAIERFNLDPAPWPCAGRAQTLWPHPLAAAATPENVRADPAAQ